MHCTILVRSRSKGIGDGLTYDAGTAQVHPGSLVRVPLRKQHVEGVVLDVSDTLPTGADYTVRAIEGMLGGEPLLTKAQIMTLRWMAGYYHCTLRQAIGAFLPFPRWSTLLPDSSSSPPTTYDIRHAFPLTQAQGNAAKAIAADARPALLFGVTGSGKTHVYGRLIADTAQTGKQSILLLPDILLTEHTIQRFTQLFDRERIAVLHSRLTISARRKEWQRIRRGDVALVIGSRSALFAPCRYLGLIILDEEHEWTYKNEQTPRYHARETAEVLCAAAGARLVLGSATPSLESWSHTKEGRYRLVRLSDRYAIHAPPCVRVIDLGLVRFGPYYPFSPPLLEAIRTRLERHEQAVLFLNRRGMASALHCPQCRQRIVSQTSQLPYTVHRTPGGQPFLLDHITGDRRDIPAVCPSCGAAQLQLIGAGTQRLEDILAGLFPDARLLRADSDMLRHPEQMRYLLQQMESGQADILLGTQSVVKGLHLPRVTLASVLLADIGLSLPHFRAGERVFQLLSQLTGRSGRGLPGEVIIQTFRPDAPEILMAAQHRTEEYLEEELRRRMEFRYPPVIPMMRLIITPPDAGKRAGRLHTHAQDIIARHHLTVTATCAPTLFGGGRTWHILLKGKHVRAVLKELDLTSVAVDVDPMECL